MQFIKDITPYLCVVAGLMGLVLMCLHIFIWLIKKVQKQNNRGRGVSYMTYDLKQELFTSAVKNDDMKLMKKLLDLSDMQRARRINNIK